MSYSSWGKNSLALSISQSVCCIDEPIDELGKLVPRELVGGLIG